MKALKSSLLHENWTAETILAIAGNLEVDAIAMSTAARRITLGDGSSAD
jgi:hypothetical protein